MEIMKVKMKEIHNYIGNKLKECMDFKFVKANSQMERINEFKIDTIKWNAKKYSKNKHLLLSFTILIRHKIIDELFEKLFNCKTGTEYMIWFHDTDKIYGSGHTSFVIKTMENLNDAIEKMLNYYRTDGNIYFNQFNNDIDKKLDSWSEKPALKRLILCNIVDKNNITKIHNYNMNCCTSVPSKTDFYIKRYNSGIKILNTYFGEKVIEEK
jgi:hypothetical protein